MAKSSESLKEISEEDASRPPFGSSVKQLCKHAVKAVYKAILLTLCSYTALWFVGVFFHHPRWMVELCYGLALLLAIKAAVRAITMYLVPSRVRHESENGIKLYAILSVPLLLYALASPALHGHVVASRTPTYFQWLAFYVDQLLSGLTLGSSKLLVPSLSSIKTTTVGARIGDVWVQKVLALGVIGVVLDSIWDLVGYLKEFEGTLEEFRVWVKREFPKETMRFVIYTSRLGDSFNKRQRPVSVHSFLMLKEGWQIETDGQLIHNRGEVVYDAEELNSQRAMELAALFFTPPKVEPLSNGSAAVSPGKSQPLKAAFAVCTILGILAAPFVLRSSYGSIIGQIVTWLLLALLYAKSFRSYLLERRDAALFIMLSARKNKALYGEESGSDFGLRYDFDLLSGKRKSSTLSTFLQFLSFKRVPNPIPEASADSRSDNLDVFVTFARSTARVAWMMHSFPLIAQGAVQGVKVDLHQHFLIIVGQDGTEEIIDSLSIQSIEASLRLCNRIVTIWCHSGTSVPTDVSDVHLDFDDVAEPETIERYRHSARAANATLTTNVPPTTPSLASS